MQPFAVVLLGAAVALVSCAAPVGFGDREGAATTTAAAVTTGAATPAAVATSVTTTTAPARTVAVRYRLDRRSADPFTADFETTVRATLADPRGWQQAGFAIVEDSGAPFSVVLAEAAEAQQLCLPLDVYSRYSCQNGPVVVLNADRWRTATPEWTGDLATYRQMLVNHEFGHLLGRRHVPCGDAATTAPVMCQQSTELGAALPNPWPLPEEVVAAALHDRPIAPAPGQ